jgi:hypothetical protein
MERKTISTAHAVSGGLLTTLTRVQFEANLCEICCGQSGTDTCFSASNLGFPHHYHSAIAPRQYCIHLQSTPCNIITGSIFK